MNGGYRYRSLEDYLIALPLTVNGYADDGGGAHFPIKGREIEATILFADMRAFSRCTKNLTPSETLAFVSHFCTWMTTEAIRDGSGIVDKYIGDEIMIIFSREFGSTDPFVEAVQAAGRMCAHDSFSFRPRIGIASGVVIVGYVGTPLRYNCSVFGYPVTLAARCGHVSESTDYSIVTPTSEWAGRELASIFPLRQYDGGQLEDQMWEVLPGRMQPLKNLPDTEVVEIVRRTAHFPSQTAIDRAKETVKRIAKETGSDDNP